MLHLYRRISRGFIQYFLRNLLLFLEWSHLPAPASYMLKRHCLSDRAAVLRCRSSSRCFSATPHHPLKKPRHPCRKRQPHFTQYFQIPTDKACLRQLPQDRAGYNPVSIAIILVKFRNRVGPATGYGSCKHSCYTGR